MFKKSGKICVGVLAALTLSAGNNSFAACTDLIVEEYSVSKSELNDKNYKKSHGDLFNLIAGTTIVGGAVVSSAAGAVANGIGAAVIGGFSLSSALANEIKAASNNLSDSHLNPSQGYAYSVLNSSLEDFNNIAPHLASFIKNVKRESSKDRSAIIPTDDEIIRAIETLNHDLSACMDADGEFYMPEKSDLLKTVVDYLNY